jgi:hypothetical protein
MSDATDAAIRAAIGAAKLAAQQRDRLVLQRDDYFHRLQERRAEVRRLRAELADCQLNRAYLLTELRQARSGDPASVPWGRIAQEGDG